MRGDLRISKVRTSSCATAIQIVRYVNRKYIVVRHVGSARKGQELEILMQETESTRNGLCIQPSFLLTKGEGTKLLYENHLSLNAVNHLFAHKILRQCSQMCGLGSMHPLYQNLTLMRVIEPTSKRRTIELLKAGFEGPTLVSYRASKNMILSHFINFLSVFIYGTLSIVPAKNSYMMWLASSFIVERSPRGIMHFSLANINLTNPREPLF